MPSGGAGEAGAQGAAAAGVEAGLAQEGAHIPAERAPWVRRVRRERARPAGVRGPVLRPPWRRQRPFFMAGWRHAPPQRMRAPQRGAARKSPERLPFFR